MNKEEFPSSMKIKREYYGLTLDDLTQEVRRRGYPVSINKLWRLENGKLRKIDYELRIRLEAIFDDKMKLNGRQIEQDFFLDPDDVIELLDRIDKGREFSDLLQNSYLRDIYHKIRDIYPQLMNHFISRETETVSDSVQEQERQGRANRALPRHGRI